MGVVNAGSSPAPALQDSLTGKTSAVLFLQILVVGLLNFWCGGVTAAPQPFTNECWQDYIEGNFIVLRARGFNLANHSSFVWANADRITLVFAGSIPARSLLRKSCLFCRPPGECRQDYKLTFPVKQRLAIPCRRFLFKEKNHG